MVYLFHSVRAVSGIPLVLCSSICVEHAAIPCIATAMPDIADNMLLGPQDALLACPNPNAYCAAYTLALQRRMRCSPTVKVNRFKPFFQFAGAPPAPGRGGRA